MSLTKALTNAVDGVLGIFAADAAQKALTYKQTVGKVADDKPVKPADLVAVLEQKHGKPVKPEHLQLFEADVKALLARREQHATYQRLPGNRTDLAAKLAERLKFIPVRDATLQRLHQEGLALDFSVDELEKEQKKLQAMRDPLAQSCSCPVLLAKMTEAEARRAEKVKHRAEAAEVARRHSNTDPDHWAKAAGIEIKEQPRPYDWSPMTHGRIADPRAMAAWVTESERLASVTSKLDAELRGAEAAIERLLDEMANWNG